MPCHKNIACIASPLRAPRHVLNRESHDAYLHVSHAHEVLNRHEFCLAEKVLL